MMAARSINPTFNNTMAMAYINSHATQGQVHDPFGDWWANRVAQVDTAGMQSGFASQAERDAFMFAQMTHNPTPPGDVLRFGVMFAGIAGKPYIAIPLLIAANISDYGVSGEAAVNTVVDVLLGKGAGRIANYALRAGPQARAGAEAIGFTGRYGFDWVINERHVEAHPGLQNAFPPSDIWRQNIYEEMTRSPFR